MKRLLFLILFLTQPAIAESPKYGLKNPDFKIEPYVQLQGWAVQSLGRNNQTDGDAGLDGTEQRTNFFFRRARLGFKGNPYQGLSYIVSLYYDNAGHDSMAATRATTLPVTTAGRSTDVSKGAATVGLWDTYLTWKISQSDLIHVTAGYFRPQISRESITAAFNVNSFEKAPNQNYIRQSVIGRGFGRGTGINVGGIEHINNFGLNYNVGIFNKVTTAGNVTSGSSTVELGESQGEENSLVYVARLALTYGDAEMSQYGLGYNINYFGKRNGVTFALNGSTQDSTPTYKGNKVIGGDILFNWGPLNIDGEYFYIFHKPNGSENYSRSRTGHLRSGYNFFLRNGTVLEPAFMVSGFFGEEGAEFTGRDTVYDFGLNWYLDGNRYKFYAHYVKQDGDGDNLVHKDGPTGFHYGDYAGLGVTLQF